MPCSDTHTLFLMASLTTRQGLGYRDELPRTPEHQLGANFQIVKVKGDSVPMQQLFDILYYVL